MGLAASQAKLLSITSRLSTLELRSQQISRAKEALAMDTAKISEEYENGGIESWGLLNNIGW